MLTRHFDRQRERLAHVVGNNLQGVQLKTLGGQSTNAIKQIYPNTVTILKHGKANQLILGEGGVSLTQFLNYLTEKGGALKKQSIGRNDNTDDSPAVQMGEQIQQEFVGIFLTTCINVLFFKAQIFGQVSLSVARIA